MNPWGNVTLVIFVVLVGLASSSMASNIPIDVNYEIIKKDTLGSIKCSLDVRINKKVSKEVLRSLAIDLKNAQHQSYDRIFINYYLPDMEVGHGSWATSHFNPDLKVVIQGLTAEEESKLKAGGAQKSSGNIVGMWLNDSPYMGHKITILKENGKFWMVREYKDGSSGKYELIKATKSGKDSYTEKGNQHGEYYLVDGAGNLSSYDPYGLIDTYQSIN